MAPKSPLASAPAKAATKTPPRQYRKPTPMDPISANKVWKEHCDKCDALPAVQGPFQLDPRTSKWQSKTSRCNELARLYTG